jgi:hypothetical protein
MRQRCVITVLLASLAAPAPGADYTAAERRHWAYQPRAIVKPPAGAANPIDAFIQDRLRKEGLTPSPPASKLQLLRRVTFDLTGLPPTVDEMDAFLKDTSPQAYARVVDRLLASPHYGERWGQHWLDVVRFAETDGFEYDTHRLDAWRYRDYVIRSFQADKPFNQFVREQLAGDEIDPSNPELCIASGFNRLGPLRKNAGNQEVASSRNEVLTEMTNIVGQAFLGVTLGCARCHDHKFDAIRQKDYYRIQAYFSAVHDRDVPIAPEGEQKAWQERKDAVDAEIKALKEQLKSAPGDGKERLEQFLKDAEAKMPAPLPALFSVVNDPSKASPVRLLNRGDYNHPHGDLLGRRPLGVLLDEGAPELPATVTNPRTQLAEWLTQPAHPLTARVLANRIWHYHFGRGLVATPNDFGRMGQRPSHPELLDFLAQQLVDSGWRWKPLHRLILLSETYQQSSANNPAAFEKDPENKLLWRFSRRRLEAEEIRDALLAASGQLNRQMGGPSIMVPVDQSLIDLMYKPSQWQVHAEAAQHNRRSVYLIAKRNLRLPLFEVFDAPDLQLSCPRREQSTHAPQALELLNGDTSNRLAKALAARLPEYAGTERHRQIEYAWRTVVGRPPTADERRLSAAFLAQQPVSEFTLALFNLNAFLYVE